MKTIAVVNNKGGVTKTTSAANIGACLAYLGHSVLLIDSDGQANLSQHFNFYGDNIESTLLTAYRGAKKKKGVELPLHGIRDNLYIVPAELELKEMEDQLTSYGDPARVLTGLTKQYADLFDYCIIDCPPALGNLTKNAIFASDSVIIPIAPGQFSVNGVDNIIGYLAELKMATEFDILGVFVAKYDARTKISEKTLSEVSDAFEGLMFDTVIRVNTDIENAQVEGKDIFSFSKRSHSAADYQGLTKEILARLKN